MGPDECDECCLGCICATFGYCFCCRAMNKSTRIKILWAWLLLSITISCVLLGCVVYSPDTLLSSPSDMRPIRNHVNFLFCEEVHVTSSGLDFSGYVINGDLQISTTNRVNFNQSTAMFVDREDFRFMPFYFLQNTTIQIKHCTSEPLVFYVIQGRDTFEAWKRFRSCDNCYIKKIYLHATADCDKSRTVDIYKNEFEIEDEYFIIYSNDNTDTTWVNIDLSLDRSVYEIESATVYCVSELDCDMVLLDPKDTAVIWVNSHYDLAGDTEPKFTTKCVPRIWAYLVLHGFPVLFIGISCSIFIQKMCRNPNDRDEFTSERSPLLINPTLPPTYSSVYLSPPKYEDIIRDAGGPPSYTEAVTNLPHSAPSRYNGSARPNHSQSDPTRYNQQSPPPIYSSQQRVPQTRFPTPYPEQPELGSLRDTLGNSESSSYEGPTVPTQNTSSFEYVSSVNNRANNYVTVPVVTSQSTSQSTVSRDLPEPNDNNTETRNGFVVIRH